HLRMSGRSTFRPSFGVLSYRLSTDLNTRTKCLATARLCAVLGRHALAFPPSGSQNLFVLVLSCPEKEQNPKDFVVFVDTPRPLV
ncbi:hypothetical protein, partial [Pricia antarctica]|uniref:hypothetical protein n=1 Tax=Pricia antarctica TaxID=641691 RepID=UPI001C312E23